MFMHTSLVMFATDIEVKKLISGLIFFTWGHISDDLKLK